MSNESTSLDSLLNDEPAVEAVEAPPAPEPAAEPAEAPSGPVRDESGRFAAKGVEEPVPPTDKLPQEDYKAIREEREKRQAAERELEALRSTVQQLQQPQEPPAPPPTVWDDDQAWGNSLVSTAVQQSAYQSKLATSEFYARKNVAGFEEKWPDLNNWLHENPAVAQELAASPDPWGLAYERYSNVQAIKELGAVDLADLEAKMRERIMAEMQTPAQPMMAPPSLTGERNVGARSGPAWTGPRSITELLR